MLVVAGLSLKNLQPRVWDPESPFYLAGLGAVMVSYADLMRRPALLNRCLDIGLHTALGIPSTVRIYLDNGSFALKTAELDDGVAYRHFVQNARPDWWPISRDYLPHPSMESPDQYERLIRTAWKNRKREAGEVPVLHVGPYCQRAADLLSIYDAQPAALAIGGIVPHLLRSSKALPYKALLADLRSIRNRFQGAQIHVFGLGGTATLHIAALLGMDSADSSGWRNRAARGIVQLPGSGDRSLAKLGSWRGRAPSNQEWDELRACPCPACSAYGIDGLMAGAIHGFCCRATHNLWVLLQEAEWIKSTIASGAYAQMYDARVSSSMYRPLISELVQESVMTCSVR